MKKLLSVMLFAFTCSGAFAIPEFSLPWVNADHANATFSTKETPSKVYVIETFFLGCPYCNENAPNINDLASSYANDPRVVVLDVGIDKSASQYQQWIQRHHPNHPVLNDSQHKVTGPLGTQGYPSTYVLDSGLNVIWSHEGEFESGTAQAVRDAIDGQLNRGLVRSCHLQ